MSKYPILTTLSDESADLDVWQAVKYVVRVKGGVKQLAVSQST